MVMVYLHALGTLARGINPAMLATQLGVTPPQINRPPIEGALGAALAIRLVPDDLWVVVESLLPQARQRPQGGGRPRISHRPIFTAVVYVLTSGCAWRNLPKEFGITVPTAYRRHAEWTEANVWHRLREAVANDRACAHLVDWTDTIAWCALQDRTR